jgi:hypothetical protein
MTFSAGTNFSCYNKSYEGQTSYLRRSFFNCRHPCNPFIVLCFSSIVVINSKKLNAEDTLTLFRVAFITIVKVRFLGKSAQLVWTLNGKNCVRKNALYLLTYTKNKMHWQPWCFYTENKLNQKNASNKKTIGDILWGITIHFSSKIEI